MSMHMLVFAEA